MATLTTEQAATLKAYILADTELAALAAITDWPLIAMKLSDIASPDFKVARTVTPIPEIQDAITWANYTPANPVDGAGQDYLNRVAQCALKRDNLWCILSASGSGFGAAGLATSKPNIVAGLQDCLTGIPSGAGGATRNAGWTTVQLIIQRKATRLEKLFAVGTGSQASPATMVYEGSINPSTLQLIMV